MQDAKPKYIGRKLISVGFVLTGLVLAGAAIFMVWDFGEGLGATPHQQRAYGVAHVALHVFGMLTAFSIGIYLVDRSWAWAALCTILALGVGSYGISNITGFAAKNRISVSDAVKENDRRAMKRYEAARADLIEKRNWAAGMSMSFENSGYERREFKKKEADYKKQIDELKMPQVTAATVTGDAGASVLSRFSGSADETWQVRLAVTIGVLMFMGEFFSFILAGRMWPTEKTVTDQASRGTQGGSGGGERKLKQVHPEPKPEPAKLRAEPSYKPSSAPLSVSTDAPQGKLTYEQFSNIIRQDMAHGEPETSTRALAHMTNWSQSSVVREQHKVRGRKHGPKLRRFAGNGGGFHVSANG